MYLNTLSGPLYLENHNIERFENGTHQISCWGWNNDEWLHSNHKLWIIPNIKSQMTQCQWKDQSFELDIMPEQTEARNVRVGDAIVIPKMNIAKNDLQTITAGALGEIQCSDELLEFLGWFVAEGSVDMGGTINRFSFSICNSKEQLIAQRLRDIGIKVFGVDGVLQSRDERDTLVVRFYQSHVARWLLDFGHLAENKHIPDYLWSNLSFRQWLVFLNAYWLGDGYKRTTELSISTVSKYLAHQLWWVVYNLNGYPNLRTIHSIVDEDGTTHMRKWWVAWYDKPYGHRMKVGYKAKCGLAVIVREINRRD